MRQRFSDEKPRVSVLLPVRNAERYLAEALASVLSQGFTDFEVCALDDGSTDASLSILRDAARRDPRVRVFAGDRAGVAAALNRLIAVARGDYLARMDADDVALPDRFARQVAYLDEAPGCIAVGGTVELMDAEGRAIAPSEPPFSHAAIDAGNLSGRVSMTHPAVMMRAAAVRAAGGYDETFVNSEDLDLWLRLAEEGQLANLPGPVLRYRLHPESVSGADQAEQEIWCRRACEAAWVRRGVKGRFLYQRWRPDDDPSDRLRHMLRLGWRAWRAGNRSSWRHLAISALRLAPGSADAWRLAAFGLIRRPGPEMEV